MKMNYYALLFGLFFGINHRCQSWENPKIIGLVPGRNESRFIKQCLKSLALYTDAIVYLDDASDDDSLQIVESLAQECRVEAIIRKEVWHRDEPGDRNALLQMGRKLNGTHFIVLDVDEMLTANCLEADCLRRAILALKPGETMLMRWIQLWRSPFKYRDDESAYNKNHYQYFIFCDDRKATYRSDFIHTMRVPAMQGNQYRFPNTHGVLHFPHIDWRSLLIKMAWYRCMERIRLPHKTSQEINRGYARCVDETGLRTYDTPMEWYEGYDFFDPVQASCPEVWREKQILQWFDHYGKDYFADLDIWDIDWSLNAHIQQ